MPSQNLIGFVGQSMTELGPWRLVHWWLAAVTLAAAGWLVFSKQHRRQVADREAGWLMWHWFTGGPLEPRRALPTEQWPRRTAVGAGRTLGTATLGAGEYVRSGAPRGTSLGTILLAGVVVAAIVAAGTLGIIHAARRTAHYVQWVRPLHKAVWRLAGWDEAKRPTSYIKVPHDRGASGAKIVVGLSPGFDARPARIEAVVETIKAKLDIRDYSFTPVLSGRHSHILMRPPTPMPEIVRFADPAVRELVDSCRPSAPLFGLGRGGHPVTVDLDSDAPHLLLSAGTGAGKSFTLHMIATQLMAHGAEVITIDHKRHSHRWIRHLEGIEYAREMEEIHHTLCAAAAEARRRNKLWDNVDITDVGPDYKRVILLCEELNATMHLLKEWWRMVRTPQDPTVSPAVAALREILYMGRAVKTHIFAVAQMAIANDVGGPAARENFQVRILAGAYTKNNWNMLVPQCDYIPSSPHKGRAMVCHGTNVHETQLVMMTEHEARGLVVEKRGFQVARPALVAPAGNPRALGESPVTVASGGPVATSQRFDGVQPITLRQASYDKGEKVVRHNLDALRQARQRNKKGAANGFPKPVGKGERGAELFPPAELQRWEQTYPAAVGSAIEIADTGRNEVDEVDRMEAMTNG